MDTDLILFQVPASKQHWQREKLLNHSVLLNCNQGLFKALLELDKKYTSKLLEN